MKNKIIFNYYIDNTVLQNVCAISDLGILFDSSLTFNSHLDNVCKESLKMLGFIFRNTKDFLNIDTIKLLYVSLVRSKLEYLTPIWCPFYTCHQLRI